PEVDSRCILSAMKRLLAACNAEPAGSPAPVLAPAPTASLTDLPDELAELLSQVAGRFAR
ncbi:MAG TPA: hypothetical protein PKW35_19595, partial [Nannocystaceae bacterium]|nr:hypothetical protein [Nannocystaceae bacterium]